MRSKASTFLLLLLQLLTGASQNYTPADTNVALSQLDERGKLEYINQNFYSIYSADFTNSLLLTREAVELSRALRLPQKEAIALKNYGIVCYLVGDYEKALPAYLRSYDLYDSLGDKSGLAQLCNEMANFYQKQGEFEKSLNLWDQSAELAKESNDLRTLGTSYGMQATFHWIRKNYKKSDSLYLKCHAIRLEQNDSVGLGYTYLDLADIERRKGHHDKALQYFNESTKIREAIGDYQGVLENYKAIADFYFQTNKYQEAIDYYNRAIEESEDFGYPDLVRKSMDSLSSLFAKTSQFRKSLELKIQAENLEDSLFNIDRSMVISRLQTQYETEKKEQQIALQNAELAEQEARIERNRLVFITSIIAFIFILMIVYFQYYRLKRRQQLKLQEAKLKAKEVEINATISSQERERNRYARDLHDGFGQMISVLNMNLQNLKNGSKPDERHKVFQSSSKIIDDMYAELKNICFDLMPQTLIKNGLESALREFTDRINTSDKVHVELNVFGIDKRLIEIQEISLYRISQEWINNILKYSDADKITLQITKDDREITLLIEDNGSGFNKEDLTCGKGNGWRNLNTRSSLIKGEIELETSPKKRGNVLIVNAPAELPIPISDSVKV